MNVQSYKKRLNFLKEYNNKLSQQEYDKQFKLSSDQLKNFKVSGIAIDKNKNKLLLTKNTVSSESVLLYANRKNDFYYLNSGKSYNNTVKSLFGIGAKYEIIDNNLFIYNEKKRSITDFKQLDQMHNKKLSSISFDTPIEIDRKQRLINQNIVNRSARERLALSLGLSSNIFNDDIKVSKVEGLDNGKGLLTIENKKTNKQEFLISDFKENFLESIHEKLKVNPTMRLGFEEVKNASTQIAMGFLEFYGAEFDEETLEKDPKIILEEKGYTISKIDKFGKRNDISNQNTLEKALNEVKKHKNINKNMSMNIEQNRELIRSEKND